MKSRREPGAQSEGGRNVRPLSMAGRALVAMSVLALLAFALRETLPEELAPELHNGTEKAAEDVRQIDWDSLPESIVAWVEVPGTSIDEPIAQASPENPDYYLHHDAFGQGAYGTPYIDCDCTPESPFVVVYGHHMSDGSVFADFADFIDRDYAESHKAIYIYTRHDNERIELEINAVDVVNANRELIRTTFNDDDDRKSYLKESIDKSDLVLDSDFSNQSVWGFATCSYQTPNSRTVVFASSPSDLVRVGLQRSHN